MTHLTLPLLLAACASQDALSEQAPPPSPPVLWETRLHHDAILDRGLAVASDGALLVPGEDGTGQAAVMRLTVHPQTGLVEQTPFTEGKAYNQASLSLGDLDQDGVDDLLVIGLLYGDTILRVYDHETGALMLRRTLALEYRPHQLALVQADPDPTWEMLAVGTAQATLLDQDGSALHEVGLRGYMGLNLVDLGADGVPEVVNSAGELLDGLTLTVAGRLPVQLVEQVQELDADEDGDTDLLVSDPRSRDSWTLIDGPTLTPRWTRTVGVRPPAHFDINGDGRKDLAFISETPGAPVSWIDTATGTFGGRLTTPDRTWLPDGLVAWDHDGDGSPELLAGGADYEGQYGTDRWGTVARLWDPQVGWLARPPLLYSSFNLTAGDVDGDGWSEVLTGGRSDMATDVGMIDGRTGELVLQWEMPVTPYGSDDNLLLADLDGDGNDELVTLNEHEETVMYDLTRTRLGPPRVLGDLGNRFAKVRDASGADAVVGYGYSLPITWWGGGRTWSYPVPWNYDTDVTGADWDGDGVEEVMAVDGLHLHVIDQRTGSLLHREDWGFWSGITVYEHGGDTDLILWGQTTMDRYALIRSQPPQLQLLASVPKPEDLQPSDNDLGVFGDLLLVPSGDLLWWNLANGRMGRSTLGSGFVGIRPQAVEGGALFKTGDRRLIALDLP
jgi:hypothetical protein